MGHKEILIPSLHRPLSGNAPLRQHVSSRCLPHHFQMAHPTHHQHNPPNRKTHRNPCHTTLNPQKPQTDAGQQASAAHVRGLASPHGLDESSRSERGGIDESEESWMRGCGKIFLRGHGENRGESFVVGGGTKSEGG